MAAAETARLVAELSFKDKFSAGVKSAIGAANNLDSGLGRVGKGVGQVGAGLARIGALAAGAAAGGLALAAREAINFEDAFAGVRKTVDEKELTAAGLSFDTLSQSFRKMATEIPIAATEFARIGEAAGALGIKAQDIETFTKTVGLLGVTTNLTSDEAAESLGKIGTILGLTGKDFTAFADALVNLGNKGASTETEIIEVTKRFGAAGKQAGLSTDQILGFASAIASAGVEPEAAGSSLSRLFNNLIKETALASDKGKEFAAVSGKSFKDFSKVVKNDTTAAMLLFLDSLRKLDKFEQIKALKGVGITNVRDINAIQLLASTYDKNLIPSLQNAKDSVGALSIEAQKRFDTLASKLTLVRQNFIEAALVIGEGFTPAVGRAADKLIAFLKVDANKSALKTFGEDIGKAIDAIDWKQVLDGAKTFVGVLQSIISVLMAIPTEIKAATLAFIGLNKVSGGLLGTGVGNIVGGLAGAITKGVAARIPGVGALFAQPVFVTNWPLGGGLGGAAGGAAGAAGGIGLATLAAGAAVTVAAVAAVGVTRHLIAEASTKQAEAIHDTLRESLASGPSVEDLKTKLAAIDTGINQITANPLLVLVQGDALTELQGMRKEVADALTLQNLQQGPRGFEPGRDTRTRTVDLSPDGRDLLRQQKDAIDRATTSIEKLRGGFGFDIRASGQATAAAIRDKDWAPKITVKTYTNVTTTVSVREGQHKSRSASTPGFTIGVV
jgi:TP901 family phage tail tape measure protein